MERETRKKLEGRTIVNARDKKYPFMEPTINTLKLHLKIYDLIDEYNSLYTDYKNACAATQKLISPRLNAIENELLNFWIVEDKDMEERK